MNNLAFTPHTAQHRPPARCDRMIAEVLLEFRRKPIACDTWIGFVLRPVDRCAVCITQSRSRLDQGIQYRLKVESGAADDLEHVGRRSLLFTRLFQFAYQRGYLLLRIGAYLGGRHFASLGPSRTLALHRLSASTASLHV